MAFRIREATSNEVSAIVDLNDDIQRQHAVAYPDDFVYPTDPKAVFSFFENLLKDDHQQLILALADDQPLAYLWYEIQRLTSNPFRPPMSRLYIQHVAVHPNHRRLGIARMLFDHVKGKARSGHHAEVALDMWASNHDAKAFFSAQGYDPYRLVFRKKLA